MTEAFVLTYVFAPSILGVLCYIARTLHSMDRRLLRVEIKTGIIK